MPISREQAAAELVKRGAIKPEELSQYGLGDLGRQYSTGFARTTPYDGGPDKVATRNAWQAEKSRIGKDREAVINAGRNMPLLDEFENINKTEREGGAGIASGGLDNWGPFGMVKQAMHPEIIPGMQRMAGIASVFQGQARPVGSGSTSDFEQRLYRMGVPSPDKLGPVNANIIHYMRGTYAEQQDRLNAEEKYLEDNGTMNGFTEAWGKYTRSNPYTKPIPGNPQSVRVNGDRQPWDEFFGQKPARARVPIAAKPSDLPQKKAAPAKGFKILSVE